MQEPQLQVIEGLIEKADALFGHKLSMARKKRIRELLVLAWKDGYDTGREEDSSEPYARV